MAELQPVPFGEKFQASMKQRFLRMARGDHEGIRRDQEIGRAFKSAREEKQLSIRDLVDVLEVEGVGEDEVLLFETGLLSYSDLPEMAGPKLAITFPEAIASPAMGKLIAKDIEDLPERYDGSDVQGNL